MRPEPAPSPGVPRIFLSSTRDDLGSYRTALRDSVLRMEAYPNAMETFGASPEAPVAVSMARVAESDGLVVLVAHRLGWVPNPEDGGREGKSITRLEVEEAMRLGKPVWAFLVDPRFPWTESREQDALADPDVAGDPEQAAAVGQRVLRLTEFKAWLQSEAKITTDTVSDPSDFAAKATSRLAAWFRASSGKSANAPAASRIDPLALYRPHLTTVHRDLVPFFDRTAERTLGDVHVELTLDSEALVSERTKWAESREREREGHSNTLYPRLGDLMAMDPEATETTGRWIILGDPGSGKSTACRNLCYELAEDPDGPVPVFVSLARWAKEGRHPLRMADEDLAEATTQHLRGSLQERLVELGSESGKLWFLLDGLDEVASGSRRQLIAKLTALVAEFPAARFTVTSRKAGFEPFNDEFLQAELRPLEKDARLELLTNWLPDTGHEIWNRIRASPALLGLSRNPLLLTLLARLAGEEEGQLPQTRAEVYERSILLLLERGQGDQEGVHAPDTAIRILPELSLRIHEMECESWTRREVFSQLYATLKACPDLIELLRFSWDSPDQFLNDVAFKSGLLAPRGSKNDPWAFLHRSLREYLAATALASRGDDSWRKHLGAMQGKEEAIEHWGETLVMVCGQHVEPDELVLGLAEIEPELGLRAFESTKQVAPGTTTRLIAKMSEWENRSRILDGMATRVTSSEEGLQELVEIASRTTDGNDLFFIDQACSQFASLYSEIAEEAQLTRAKSLSHLAAPEESLFQVIRSHANEAEPLWAEIPSGRFKMGSSDGGPYGWESPQHEVELSAFRAAIVPVTVAQFRAFDPGHNPYFQGKVPDDELAHHPVVHVTWYEAVSFCRWLSHQFEWARGARLPTEAEWEYLCRAGTTTEWWCGDEVEALSKVAWYYKDDTGTTHPVARKQANAWGLYDVHGNVWEWCQDWLTGSYPGTGLRTNPTGSESGPFRVVRGGSFRNVARRLRSASRSGRQPDNRNLLQSFRVVLPAAR